MQSARPPIQCKRSSYRSAVGPSYAVAAFAAIVVQTTFPSSSAATGVAMEAVTERIATAKTLLHSLRGNPAFPVVAASEARHVIASFDALGSINKDQMKLLLQRVREAEFGEDAEGEILYAVGSCRTASARPAKASAASSHAAAEPEAAAAPPSSARRKDWGPFLPSALLPLSLHIQGGGSRPLCPRPGRRQRTRAGGRNGPRKEGSRGGAQNFEAIIQYVPQPAWNVVKDTGSPEPIISIALRLGLRKPTPHTQQTIAVATMLHHGGIAECELMSAEARTKLVYDVGASIRRRTRTLTEPEVWLAELPGHPAELKATEKALYDIVFGSNSVPVSCPVAVDCMAMMKAITKCRQPKGACGLRAATPTLDLSPSAKIPDQWIQMGKSLMREVASLKQELHAQRPALPALLDAPSPQTGTGLLDAASPQTGIPHSADSSGKRTAEEALAGEPSAPPVRARMSVGQASALILAGYIEKPGGKSKMPEATAAAAATPEATAAAAATPVPKKKHAAGGECCVRYEEKKKEKMFVVFWRNLECRSFSFKGSKEKPEALKLAKVPEGI